MPIYEYACRTCKQTFELMRPLDKRDAKAKCTSCGSMATSRKISMFAVANTATPDLLHDDASPGEFGMGGDDFGMDDDFDF